LIGDVLRKAYLHNLVSSNITWYK